MRPRARACVNGQAASPERSRPSNMRAIWTLPACAGLRSARRTAFTRRRAPRSSVRASQGLPAVVSSDTDDIHLNDPQTLYRRWEESQWSPFTIDLSTDRRHWMEMTGDDQLYHLILEATLGLTTFKFTTDYLSRE